MPSSLPPGPPGPALLHSVVVALGQDKAVSWAVRRYGDTFTTRILGLGTIVATSRPEHVKQVFAGKPHELYAGEGNEPLAMFLGRGSLLILDGAEHLRHRRLLLPPFHGDRLDGSRALVAQLADEALDRWPVGEPFRVLPELQRLTVEIILQVVFGIREEERLELWRDPMRRLLNLAGADETAVRYALRRVGTLRSWRRLKRVLAETDELVYEEIMRRRERADLAQQEDVMSLLLQARDEDGEPMTDRELRDELITLIAAGHETTSTALAWTFERLVRHPDVLERLTEEARAADGDAYANAVAREALRVRPPIPFIARRTMVPFRLGEHELPPGVRIVPLVSWVHRRPDVYPDPTAFRPERWLDRNPEASTWLPFGGGVRRCIGASFALLEMRTILHTVLRRAELKPVEERPEWRRQRTIFSQPSRGGRIELLERREPVAR